MNTTNRVTIDHHEIRYWAETHRGVPQVIEIDGIIALRIDFPAVQNEEYDVIDQSNSTSWQNFFDIFEAQQLAIEFVDLQRSPTERIDFSEQYRFIKRYSIKQM